MGKDKRVWRKLVKKLRRKRIRQKEALEESKLSDEVDKEIDNTLGVVETDLDRSYFLTEEEWLKNERHAEAISAMKRAQEEKVAKARAEQERKIREEWEEVERREKAEREEKERLEKARKEEQARGFFGVDIREFLIKFSWTWNLNYEETFNKFLEFLCGDIETPPVPYIMPEGYDNTDQDVCKQFLKTGACRYYDRCRLAHPSPTLSQTILIPNFFSHFLLEESLRDEYDTDVGLEYEHSDLHKEFLEFYNDVLPEFQKCGKVIQFKVCCNLEPHLRGNVYVQYENIRSSIEAFRTFNARFYNGKQISLRFVKIDSWKTAICWSFLRKNCIKGRSCNYLHVFRNPTKEFVSADKDWKEPNTSQSSCVTPRLFSPKPNPDIAKSSREKNYRKSNECSTSGLSQYEGRLLKRKSSSAVSGNSNVVCSPKRKARKTANSLEKSRLTNEGATSNDSKYQSKSKEKYDDFVSAPKTVKKSKHSKHKKEKKSKKESKKSKKSKKKKSRD